MRARTIIILLLLCRSISAQTVEERYRQFKQQAQQEYRDFRDAANRRYAEFLRGAWEYYQVMPAVPQPKEEQRPPVVYDKELEQQDKDDKPLPYEDVIIQPAPTPQPQPIAPVIENNETEVLLKVDFYGALLPFRYPKQGFTLPAVDGDRLAQAWEKLSGKEYNNLIFDCLSVRERLKLCDWAYLNLLKLVSEQGCGESNAAVFLQAFLYVQSGYQMRMAVNGQGRLFLLVGSRYMFYDRGYFELDEGKFFPFEKIDDGSGMQICNGAFEHEQPLSLLIPEEQYLTYSPSSKQMRKAQSGITAEVCVNKNLIDFYNNYPTGHYGEDFTTRWAMYAEAPLDENIRTQLYPVLSQAIRGVSEIHAVSLLLNWIQTAFEYEYDDKVWGGDRAFFPAESLYYPYCDCEDRSILFSRLVRDLLGLDIVLLYYPGHLATAIHFSQPVSGDYLVVNGKRYVVCDPTYIGAPIGATMPDMDNRTAKVILLGR